LHKFAAYTRWKVEGNHESTVSRFFSKVKMDAFHKERFATQEEASILKKVK
jgi:hypothetical protein